VTVQEVLQRRKADSVGLFADLIFPTAFSVVVPLLLLAIDVRSTTSLLQYRRDSQCGEKPPDQPEVS
jgi:hypothetical protein